MHDRPDDNQVRYPGIDPVDLARMRRKKRGSTELDRLHSFLLKTIITMALVVILLAFV